MTPTRVPVAACTDTAKVPGQVRFLRLFAPSRGVALTPFHDMTFICPEHSEVDVDRHRAAYEADPTRPAEADIG
jgi:glutamate-1-semialdehyde aminotransferase